MVSRLIQQIPFGFFFFSVTLPTDVPQRTDHLFQCFHVVLWIFSFSFNSTWYYQGDFCIAFYKATVTSSSHINETEERWSDARAFSESMSSDKHLIFQMKSTLWPLCHCFRTFVENRVVWLYSHKIYLNHVSLCLLFCFARFGLYWRNCFHFFVFNCTQIKQNQVFPQSVCLSVWFCIFAMLIKRLSDYL